MDKKYCNECDKVVEENHRMIIDFTIDINDDVICLDCGNSSHCFCDNCDEYVPTSECSMDDDIVSCNGCYIEKENKKYNEKLNKISSNIEKKFTKKEWEKMFREDKKAEKIFLNRMKNKESK